MGPLGVSAAFVRDFMKLASASQTTHEVCEAIVMPQTAEASCPYAEFFLTERDSFGSPLVGEATVFVSHAWGNKFSALCEIVLEYAEVHPETYFWIDLFAMDQQEKPTHSLDFFTSHLPK